jgi:hypothetical protein
MRDNRKRVLHDTEHSAARATFRSNILQPSFKWVQPGFPPLLRSTFEEDSRLYSDNNRHIKLRG